MSGDCRLSIADYLLPEVAPPAVKPPARPECVIGEERAAAEAVLTELHEQYLVVLDGLAQLHVEEMWKKRHIHWTRAQVDLLHRIDASLPVCLARGERA